MQKVGLNLCLLFDHVTFVADEDFGNARTRVFIDLLQPIFYIVEAFLIRQIKHNQRPNGPIELNVFDPLLCSKRVETHSKIDDFQFNKKR